MAKKRKAGKSLESKKPFKSTKYDIDETFADSEDEFYTGRDKILLGDNHDTNRQQRVIEQERNLQPSDEEILAYDESDDEETDLLDEDAEHLTDEDAGDTDEENWGSTRAAYYNADTIETENDALEEEAEAKRLQQKQLKGMTEADFGFEDSAWTETQTSSSGKRTVVEKLPETEIPEDASEKEKLNILRSRYPEFEPLAQDFVDLQRTLADLKLKVAETEKKLQAGGTIGSGVTPQTKLHALSAYLGTIAMYFAVLTPNVHAKSDSNRVTSISSADLREHSIIEGLTKARQLWDLVKDKRLSEVNVVKSQQSLSQPQSAAVQSEPASTTNGAFVLRKATSGLEAKTKSSSKAKLERKSKMKRQTKHTDLQSLLTTSALPIEEDLEFGDEDPLTQEEAAEKAKKRKSLRFYTSQIAQKANKRTNASREAGGDDDLPYKERNRDRQERLLREAEARGKMQADEQEELGDSPDEDGVVDEYYNSLVTTSAEKKAAKKARADAYAEAAKLGAQVYEEEFVGDDGKRGITYAIQKNKGLTPKRKKDVRNPRVKKRKKYDEKLKKLSSIRQVYKGGEGRGGYGGELTGIKTNIVRGIKL